MSVLLDLGRLAGRARLAGEYVGEHLPAQDFAGRGFWQRGQENDPRGCPRRPQQAAHVLGSSEIAVPREILNVQEIPLLGTGKVNYVRLKEDACRAPAIASGAG